MQVAHRGLIKNLTIPWQENRIKNMAASVNQVFELWKLISNLQRERVRVVHVHVWVRVVHVREPCHLSTLDNPHPGQAQTAVFQNTAEGNYKLGQPLDHETGSILQCILSPWLSLAKTGLGQVNNDSDLPAVTETQAGVLH